MYESFNHAITNLQPSASISFMAKARQLKNQGVDVISLAGGEPDFPTPSPIIEEAYRQMRNGFTHYTVGPGLPELREKIAYKLMDENCAPYSPDEIIVTPGGKNAIFLTLSALLNPGDEVLYLDPAWVSYVPMIQANSAVPVPVALSYTQSYRITYEALDSCYTEKAKLLIVNYPNNPTGRVLSTEESAVLERFLLNHPNLFLLSDEVYERIVFDEKHSVSPASIPSIRDRVITINSFSKSVAMTGWRLGYIAAPHEIIKQIYKLYQHSLTCVSGFIQKAAVVALDCNEQIEQMRQSYQERRNQFLSALNAVDGVEARLPDGAFYAWVKIEKGEMDSFALCDYLLREALVVGVPGESYGVGGKQCIRFSFATSLNDLSEAAARIRRVLEDQ